ncbi:MAG: class I SAM-dependent methyltransferase [Streptosporangiaceae bacterium]
MEPTAEQMAETRRTYDLIAAEFAERNSVAPPEVAARIDELAAGLTAGSRVADVGCGPGRDVVLLRARGLRVVGVDLSVGQLRARQVSGLVQADMCRLPLRDDSVDAIWCQAALLHLRRAAVPDALAEFARTVRHGGTLSMSVAEGDGEGFGVASSYASGRRRWFTLHREPSLTALLGAAGFRVRHVHRDRAHRDWLSVCANR